MYAQDSTLQPFLARSAGYAIFPAVGKGAIGIGGAYGRGQVYKSGQFIGYADISQATIGLQVGGQGYSEILAFETPDALSNFEGGRFTFAATASAVIIKAGAGAAAKYDEGVSTFINPNGGLMLEAAIGGQSFSYQPK
jgi:lipid-binding SYLF domain-containing protein